MELCPAAGGSRVAGKTWDGDEKMKSFKIDQLKISTQDMENFAEDVFVESIEFVRIWIS